MYINLFLRWHDSHIRYIRGILIQRIGIVNRIWKIEE